MDLTYLGAGAVKLSGKTLTVIANPYGPEVGLPPITAKAELVTLSSPEGLGVVAGVPTVLDSPGEYEAKGVMIMGVPARLHLDEAVERGTVYSFTFDGVGVVVTGNIAGKLDDRQLERLGKVDVLVVPVGGYGLTLDAEGAAGLVSQLEPSYVVPVHYDEPGVKYPMPQAGVEEFIKEMGATATEPVSKLRVNANALPLETEIVVLQRS